MNLLEEAKLRYPEGVTVKGIHIGITFKIKHNKLSLRHDNCVMHGDNPVIHDIYDCLYSGGKWAEIISVPEYVYEIF